MTIDPTDFAKQGKPSPQQVRTVWDSMAHPTCRAVAEQLQQRGYDISFATVGRWQRTGWRDRIENAKRPTQRKPLAEHGAEPEVRRAIQAEVQEMEPDEQLAARTGGGGLAAAVAGPLPPDHEMRMLEQRHAELMLQSEAELDVTEAKARKVFNILLLESAQRRTRVLALIPKETAALVVAMTGAAGAQLTGGLGQLPAAGDPRTIDGSINQADPDNEVAASIAMFRRKLAGEKVA